jgi:putative ABC transport system ATP-binding protein
MMLDRVGLRARTVTTRDSCLAEQQRRLARASLVVRRLFVDEPTGNLDMATGERIAQLLFELNADSNTTLVLVTHDRTIASRCGRILTMEAGGLS